MNDNSLLRRLGKAVKKDKSILFILLFLVLGVIYCNFYITAVLTKTIEISTLLFGFSVIKEILTTNDKLKLFFCVLGLEAALIIYLTDNRKQYQSRLVEITPNIHTPEPVGQNQCGSARWLTEKEFDKAFNSQIIPKKILEAEGAKELRQFQIPEAGFVLGKKDTKKGEQVYYINTDTHVLTIGATRSGKTRCSVLETIGMLGLAGESILATDVKGELVDYTRPYLEKLGYDVYTINYNEPKYSDLWNYLQVIINYVDQDDIPAAIDATWDLTAQLVGEAKGEKIWNDGEASMIAAAIMAVVYDNRKPEEHKYRNLANVYYFLVYMCKPVGNVLPLSAYVNKLADSHPAKALLAVSDIAPSRTRGSFYTAAVMTLKLFTNPYIANMSAASTFDPVDLGRKKVAVFIVLPDDRLTYHTLATLFVAQVYTMLSKEADRRGGRLKNRVNVVADEFGNFSKLANFSQMLTVAGGKGIRFNLFVQDFAQLEDKYEKTGLRIIRSNCETWVYLQTDDNETLRDISEKLGKYTTKSYSTNTSTNSSSTRVTSTGSSNNLIARELLTPDEVKKIGRPYTLVTSRNDPAIMYDPDLSRWYFNQLFGMGDPDFNRELRIKRKAERTEQNVSKQIELWGIWSVIIDEIKMKQKEQQALTTYS